MAIHKTRYVLLWFMTLSLALMSLRFLVLGLEVSFPGAVVTEHIASRRLYFIIHVFFAPIALALGFFQFLPGWRARHPRVHRWTGRLYALAVLAAAMAALVMAIGSPDRPLAASGFGVLSVLWIGATVYAVRLAIAGDMTEHRRWMIRSYALTLAALSLRLQAPFFFFLGDMSYAQASSYLAWLCWVPNLMLAQLYLRKPAQAVARHGSFENGAHDLA